MITLHCFNLFILFITIYRHRHYRSSPNAIITAIRETDTDGLEKAQEPMTGFYHGSIGS